MWRIAKTKKLVALGRTDLGVNAEVFSTGETDAVETCFLLSLFFRFRMLFAVVHQTFEFRKGFLDLRDRPRAVN